jgi:L-ascorbate metabolism protein UlaG (beta-lactamase superfamily)
MDTATIAKMWQRDRPNVITPLGNDAVLRKDIPDLQVQTGDWWDAFDLSETVRTIIVPSYHWSARNLGDRRFALWGGFVLETPIGTMYCAGDTGYRDGKIFAEIRRRLGTPLVATLPIGAYEPRWFMKSQHADPSEAVQIALDSGAQHLLGVHWGTFQLTDEPCNEPGELLQSAMAERAPTSLQARPFRAGDIWEASL